MKIFVIAALFISKIGILNNGFFLCFYKKRLLFVATIAVKLWFFKSQKKKINKKNKKSLYLVSVQVR